MSLIILSGLLVGMTSSTTIFYPKAQHSSFKSGEELRYRISYGLMDAGEAILTVNETTVKGANGRPLYHVKGVGRTLGAFNWFYKVDDTYESYIDKTGAFPWHFVRNVNEGGHKLNQKYTFKQDVQKVHDQDGKSYQVPLGIKDMISSFYFARTLDFDHMKKGDISEFQVFMDGEIWPLKIKYMGKETIKLRDGKFKCLKFVPVVQEGRYFKSEEDVQFWVTDDENRIPVLIKAKIAVGSVKMHLVEWKGLKGDISKI